MNEEVFALIGDREKVFALTADSQYLMPLNLKENSPNLFCICILLVELAMISFLFMFWFIDRNNDYRQVEPPDTFPWMAWVQNCFQKVSKKSSIVQRQRLIEAYFAQ